MWRLANDSLSMYVHIMRSTWKGAQQRPNTATNTPGCAGRDSLVDGGGVMEATHSYSHPLFLYLINPWIHFQFDLVVIETGED